MIKKGTNLALLIEILDTRVLKVAPQCVADRHDSEKLERAVRQQGRVVHLSATGPSIKLC
jgi:hypothetical protein